MRISDWSSDVCSSDLAEAIRQMGGEAFFHQVDVADSEQVRGLIAATVERYGRLDCAYNNAGVGGSAAEIDATEEKDFDQHVAVTFKGAWLCMKSDIEHMLQNGGGSNCSSEERHVGSEWCRQ